MNALGFEVVANAAINEPMAQLKTTHCLLVDRLAGVRAAIFCSVGREKYTAFVALVSEFADGTKIQTNNRGFRGREESAEPNTHFEIMPRGTTIGALHERHLARTRQLIPAGQTPILPPPGREMEYLAGRHAEARAKSLPREGWFLDETGEFYCPTWKRSFLVAAGQQKLFRKCIAWLRRKRIVRNVAGQ
jgi:hypothetical protein